MAERLYFQLLGPLEVLRDAEICTPSAPKQRALLALLLIHANELLTTTTIIDCLWESEPPRTARAALQMYVHALRLILDPCKNARRNAARQNPVLATRPFGYILHIQSDQTDLAEFRKLASRGRSWQLAGECAKAHTEYNQALAICRGSALTGLPRLSLVDSFRMRLEEERLAILEERIASDLCLGHSQGTIGELIELCDKYPLREAFYEQLMVAMCLAGRRAEALEVYRRARRVLIDQLGIPPGPQLRAAQQAILNDLAPPNRAHARCTRYP